MELKEYDRKPFKVQAVQVTLDNVGDVAQWCKGNVEQVITKMMGTETLLPCVKIPGQGNYKDQVFTAFLGYWVVGRKGSFRVYKPNQFAVTFQESVNGKTVKSVDDVIASNYRMYKFDKFREEMAPEHTLQLGNVAISGELGPMGSDELNIKVDDEVCVVNAIGERLGEPGTVLEIEHDRVRVKWMGPETEEVGWYTAGELAVHKRAEEAEADANHLTIQEAKKSDLPYQIGSWVKVINDARDRFGKLGWVENIVDGLYVHVAFSDQSTQTFLASELEKHVGDTDAKG